MWNFDAEELGGPDQTIKGNSRNVIFLGQPPKSFPVNCQGIDNPGDVAIVVETAKAMVEKDIKTEIEELISGIKEIEVVSYFLGVAIEVGIKLRREKSKTTFGFGANSLKMDINV